MGKKFIGYSVPLMNGPNIWKDQTTCEMRRVGPQAAFPRAWALPGRGPRTSGPRPRARGPTPWAVGHRLRSQQCVVARPPALPPLATRMPPPATPGRLLPARWLPLAASQTSAPDSWLPRYDGCPDMHFKWKATQSPGRSPHIAHSLSPWNVCWEWPPR